ncbi:flavodoxin-dependent (E)-4-hydroxy-3-methylbut-2-enyl-diphosphate synthase [Streptomyces sp. NPDC047999]|uniref:flavodoxin-dependent (E)-4-hydroxy-3-methylbut-2-enyl-diphosphate synthase n=1 Tax=Streptomyces sp. NPDC047999 TaxID=3365497 RepID=UPI003717C47B
MTASTGEQWQERFPLLSAHASPEALRCLSDREVERLAGEIRAFLVEAVCATGGHLGPNLGVVELTLALHRVFDSPRDSLLFDTGHQAYVHKLLTERGPGFASLRQADGLSGYPSRSESVHDLVENSHASTALSYADGLARSYALTGGRDRRVVAVVGDGALTGGIAWEALNNIGAAPHRPVIVILNDNGRSYDPTTGALAALRQGASGEAEAGGNLFAGLGFAYLGPFDGHDTALLEGALRRARDLRRPVVVHVVTVKGKGYRPAEQDEADRLHAVGAIDPATGRPDSVAATSWTDAFEQALADLAAQREDLVAVTAAMLRPTGLWTMARRHPDRVFDVGIAEQHAVTAAAGLAMGGLHPVVALYATFANRALDQILLDVALHRLPVTFVLDRAGITGADGPSPHGMWDLGVMGTVPGLRIAAPRDTAQLAALLREAVAVGDGPTMLRIPKASAGDPIEAVAQVDGLDILQHSPRAPLDVLLVPAGPLAVQTLQAAALLQAERLSVTVADPGWVLPVHDALPALAARHRVTVSIEDNIRTSGFGTDLAHACREANVATRDRSRPAPRLHPPRPPRRTARPGRSGRPRDRPRRPTCLRRRHRPSAPRPPLRRRRTAMIPHIPHPPDPPPAVVRRPSRQLRVGNVLVGGGAPVSVQTMTTTVTADVDATLQQIAEVTAAGCDIVRVAVPTADDAAALPAITARSPIPVIADIHFQPRYVFQAIDAGCAAVRVNPGNIRNFDDRVQEIAAAARDAGTLLRIGVNAGSLDPRLLAKHGAATAEALVESALWEASLFEEHGFHDIKIAVKHHDPLTVVAANRMLAGRCDYPLHLGVTEAGPALQGSVKSAVAFALLLAEGIGDTIRVSLSAPPVEQVKASCHILASLGLRPRKLEIVSCSGCGRLQVDIHQLAARVEAALDGFPHPLRIAVMGCVVNGPGEAREADLGVSSGSGNGKGQIFVKGQVIATVPEARIVDRLVEEALRLAEQDPTSTGQRQP